MAWYLWVCQRRDERFERAGQGGNEYNDDGWVGVAATVEEARYNTRALLVTLFLLSPLV